MTGFIVSRSICVGGAVGPILRIVMASPCEDLRVHNALAWAFIFGAWVFHRAIVQERARLAGRDE